MKKILSVILLCASTTPLTAAILRWDIPVGQRLEITRTARIRYLINKNQEKVYEERNIIDLTALEKAAGGTKVKGVFSVFHRESNEKAFHQREQYESQFVIEPSGHFIVDSQYYMPNLRHVPTFPDEDVKVGDTWERNAELIIKNFSAPFKLLFPASYRLEEIYNEDGKQIARIYYEYTIDKKLVDPSLPADFPLKILGKNQGIILWDITNNRPLDFKDQYRMIFLFKSGRSLVTQEFQMLILSKPEHYAGVSPEDEKKAREEIRKELPENSGVKVDSDKRGIVFRMGEVLFDFDSAALRNDTRSTLDVIAGIIKKKYPDREIIVEGHTDSTGTSKYNFDLSRRRAKSVTEYLMDRSGHDKFSYQGYGPERPIDDNSTKEGRSRNRRVEIIIKLR